MSHAPASGSKTLPSHSRKPTAPAASLGRHTPTPTRDSCRSAPADPDRQSLPPQSAPNVVAAATHPRRAAAETPSADPLGESCSSPLRPWCTNHSTLPHYALTSAKSDRLLGRLTLSQREGMVVVEPRGTGMALFTLRAAEEVRAAQFGMAEGELDAEMVAIAKAIIAQRTGSFDPTTYRDRYQEALQELIEAKMKGLTVKPREIAARPPVIDLMTALKRSLAREASGSKHTAAKKAKMAPDRRQAGSLAARSRGSETESTDRRRAHHSRSKAAQTSNCLIRTPFLRHLSRRVVRVEIGQKT